MKTQMLSLKQLKAVYERDSQTYDVTRKFWVSGYGAKREKAAILNFIKGDLILDIGIGTGRTAYLTDRRKLIGIDISFNSLKICRCKAPQVNVLEANAEELPFKKEIFDLVNISRTIKLFLDIEKVLYEAKRVLKVGGLIIISFESNTALWFNILLKTIEIMPAKIMPGKIKTKILGLTTTKQYTSQELNMLLKEARFNVLSSVNLVYFPKSFYEIRLIQRVLEWLDNRIKNGYFQMIIAEKMS